MRGDPLEGAVGFDWDEATITHIARHNVSPEEAESVFFDEDYVITADLKHSQVENGL